MATVSRITDGNVNTCTENALQNKKDYAYSFDFLSPQVSTYHNSVWRRWWHDTHKVGWHLHCGQYDVQCETNHERETGLKRDIEEQKYLKKEEEEKSVALDGSFTYFLIEERIDKDISLYCMCITSYFRRNKEAATVTTVLLADDMESPSMCNKLIAIKGQWDGGGYVMLTNTRASSIYLSISSSLLCRSQLPGRSPWRFIRLDDF
jgi:hypothetical protein